MHASLHERGRGANRGAFLEHDPCTRRQALAIAKPLRNNRPVPWLRSGEPYLLSITPSRTGTHPRLSSLPDVELRLAQPAVRSSLSFLSFRSCSSVSRLDCAVSPPRSARPATRRLLGRRPRYPGLCGRVGRRLILSPMPCRLQELAEPLPHRIGVGRVDQQVCETRNRLCVRQEFTPNPRSRRTVAK